MREAAREIREYLTRRDMLENKTITEPYDGDFDISTKRSQKSVGPGDLGKHETCFRFTGLP